MSSQQGTTRNIWVSRDDDDWVALTTACTREDGTSICVNDQECHDRIFPSDAKFGFRDATQLCYLNAPNLLENIKTRYVESLSQSKPENIYTFCGWVLIAVNPFRELNIYSGNWLERFHQTSMSASPPHPFAVAQTAYNRLLSEKCSQTVIITGESGSGKTETSKHVLKYLASASDRRHASSNDGIENRLLSTSPILEAIGNATTVRNHNSSRFGKLMNLHFCDKGQMQSASVQTFLLAKSRVVHVPSLELNYHIFYILINELDSKTLHRFHLFETTYRYLGACASNVTLNSRPVNLSMIHSAFEAVHMTTNEVESIFKLYAAILLLGELKVDEANGTMSLDVKKLENIVDLLGLSDCIDGARKLAAVLTTRMVFDVSQNLGHKDVQNAIDSLAKSLYQFAFDFVVKKINTSLAPDDRTKPLTFIGILDIFGFEDLVPHAENGFEQLCINFANEKFHCFFLNELLSREHLIYESEGVVIEALPVFEETDAVEAIIGSKLRAGIMQQLEEACHLSRKDELFCQSVNNKCQRFFPKSILPQKGRTDENFCIKHFASTVVYTASGFCERNLDFISKDFLAFLKTCPAIIADQLPRESIVNRNAKFLCSAFVNHVNLMVDFFSSTSSHFIRCIKPNDNFCPEKFVGTRVMQQLRTGGMVEVLQMMKFGFPCRFRYDDLWIRYHSFLPSWIATKMKPRDFTEIVLMFLCVPESQYKLGCSKVFFRFGALEALEKVKNAGDDFTGPLASSIVKFWLAKRLRRTFFVGVLVARLNCRRKRKVCSLVAAIVSEHFCRLKSIEMLQYFTLTRTKSNLHVYKITCARRIQAFCRVRRAKQRMVMCARQWGMYVSLLEKRETVTVGETHIRKASEKKYILAAIGSAKQQKAKSAEDNIENIHLEMRVPEAALEGTCKETFERKYTFEMPLLDEATIPFELGKIENQANTSFSPANSVTRDGRRSQVRTPITPAKSSMRNTVRTIGDKQRLVHDCTTTPLNMSKPYRQSVGLTPDVPYTPDVSRPVKRTSFGPRSGEVGMPKSKRRANVYEPGPVLDSPECHSPESDDSPLIIMGQRFQGSLVATGAMSNPSFVMPPLPAESSIASLPMESSVAPALTESSIASLTESFIEAAPIESSVAPTPIRVSVPPTPIDSSIAPMQTPTGFKPVPSESRLKQPTSLLTHCRSASSYLPYNRPSTTDGRKTSCSITRSGRFSAVSGSGASSTRARSNSRVLPTVITKPPLMPNPKLRPRQG